MAWGITPCVSVGTRSQKRVVMMATGGVSMSVGLGKAMTVMIMMEMMGVNVGMDAGRTRVR
eukprot:43723-Eustigmatos_ZCMA.PRE.1